MPTYVYQCRKCLEIQELVRPMVDSSKPGPLCCGTRMKRNFGLEQCNTDCRDWNQPVLSERMGVNPNQVAAHRKMHPNIPITDTGEIIVRNGAEERRINRELASDFGRR